MADIDALLRIEFSLDKFIIVFPDIPGSRFFQ